MQINRIAYVHPDDYGKVRREAVGWSDVAVVRNLFVEPGKVVFLPRRSHIGPLIEETY